MASEISIAKSVGTPNTSSSTPNLLHNTIDQHSSKTNNTSKPSNSLSKRIEVESLASDLQKRLGNNWDKYQNTISAFLVGRLSRRELTQVTSELLIDTKMVRMHNQLLLANLANALRDGPNSSSAKSGFGGGGSNKKKKDGRVKVSNQYDKLKRDIMALPIRERHRIKTITRESGKRTMANSALTLTRQTLLPKIPYVTDKDKNITGNTVEWTQDISHGIQTLLSTESYSLPDNESLRTRMLGIAREHGLTGSIEKSAIDIAYIGLETYLKQIVESAIDTVRYRKLKYNSNEVFNYERNDKKRRRKVILTNEDLAETFTLFPFLVEPSGPLYRLNAVQLNDDSYVEPKTSIDSILKPKPETIGVPFKSPVIQKKTQTTTSTPSTNTTPTIANSSTPNKLTSPIHEENSLKEVISNPTEQESHTNINGVEEINGSTNGQTSAVPLNVGTKDELNWLIHDILSAQQ